MKTVRRTQSQDSLEFGRQWQDTPAAVTTVYPSRQRAVRRALRTLTDPDGRSVVVVGEPGAGGAEMARHLARECRVLGDDVFEATPTEVNAGMQYVGQLDGRVAAILAAARRSRFLWLLPRFDDTYVAGAHSANPNGLLAKVGPLIAGRELRVISDATPRGWAEAVRRVPELEDTVDVIRIDPLEPAEALAAGQALLAELGTEMAADLLREAVSLAQEQVTGELPGSLLRLLREAVRWVDEDDEAERGSGVGGRHLTRALGSVTGLPPVLVDDAVPLDVEALRERFSSAVLGQPEAVQAITERLAIAKAGLSDPSRPIAVFMFVGPTGTGKTELAKQLAAFLSGSASELIRFDMSDYADQSGPMRLLGAGDHLSRTPGLVARVAAHPASVILFDEVEKANPAVWDVFLQMFDDARATDADGTVADLRHAIFILTSNLGATDRPAGQVGFGGPTKGHTRLAAQQAAVVASVERAFRPELVNRIDRIVVFRPLSRAIMRAIVVKELEDVERRRGLRTRPWALEWDDSAVEALLRVGFDPRNGARPLKRAIEQHLLGPLAETMVGRGEPTGDQFLFIRAGAHRPLDIEFVDPDLPDDAGPKVRPRAEADISTPRLIALNATGSREEYETLRSALDPLEQRIAGTERARREGLMTAMSAPGFWDDESRHEVLRDFERLEELEGSLTTALNLSRRLASGAGRRGAQKLTRLLAQRVFVLQEQTAALDADEGGDATLVLRPMADCAGADWPDRLAAMYRTWAQERGMAITERETPQGVALQVTGLAAPRLLRSETGLHVWEDPGPGARRTLRRSVLVACSEGALPPEDVAMPSSTKVVRRYAERPTPLVKDTARGWQTGRLRDILAGDFDLL